MFVQGRTGKIRNATTARAVIMPALPGVMKSMLVGMLVAGTQFAHAPFQTVGAGLLAKAIWQTQ
jgi:hypothetical protein